MKFLPIFFLMIHLLTAAENRTSVGVGFVIEGVEISGSKVIPIPRADYKTPIVLRVVRSEETDTGFRYSLHAEGLDPGNYDLAKYLKREDNTLLETEAIPLEVYSVLEKPLTEPRKLTPTKPEKLGGYTTLLWALGIAWAIGLLGIIFFKKRDHLTEDHQASPPTLTEKIAALLKQGKTNTDSQAQLERLLIGHWMEKLPELNDRPMSESLTFLRNNEESSPMILSVERWLHSGKEISEEEIERTLAPYSGNKEAQK
ncbi:MAG: hypothetical protein ACI9E1_000404 [Cryomorphaceae bacterium]|jgi:hypothetical protein